MSYQPKIISRHDAGLNSPPKPTNLRQILWDRQIALMILHYPGDPNDMPEALGDKNAPRFNAKCLSLIRTWFNYHTITKGWSDIGYSLVITRSGAIVECRGWDIVPAAHASKHEPSAKVKAGTGPFVGMDAKQTLNAMRHANYSYGLAVCVMVGNSQKMTGRQKKTLRWLRAYLQSMHSTVPNVVYGHQQLAPTSCPGPEIQAFIDSGEILKPLDVIKPSKVDLKGIDLVPIGAKTNNPGCLRPGGQWKWSEVNMVGIYSDKKKGDFAKFFSPDEGMFACMLNLVYYIDMWGKDKLSTIFPIWAPESDGNDTQAYINFVSKETGIPPSAQLIATNLLLASLGAAIAKREMGAKWAEQHFSKDAFLRVANYHWPEYSHAPQQGKKEESQDDNEETLPIPENLSKALASLKRAFNKLEPFI